MMISLIFFLTVLTSTTVFADECNWADYDTDNVKLNFDYDYTISRVDNGLYRV